MRYTRPTLRAALELLVDDIAALLRAPAEVADLRRRVAALEAREACSLHRWQGNRCVYCPAERSN